MCNYVLVTYKGTRNGFLVEAWDRSHAKELAKQKEAEGWKIYNIILL